MIPKLKEIEVFLTKLDLKTDRIPTLNEFKTNFRKKLNLHPDKAGEESSDAFKEITEAARLVFKFLTDNPELQTRKETDESSKVIKCFEKTNEVVYNHQSITFNLEDDLVDAWIAALTSRYGPSTPLADKKGIKFKTSQLKIPKLTHGNHGSLTASVWEKPNDGRSKILLQGKSFMAFLSFVVPEILKELKTTGEQPKALTESAPSFINLPVANDDKKEPSDVLVSDEGSDLQILVTSFKKLEFEINKLRVDLVGIVDDSVNTIKDSIDMDMVGKKIDNLEKAVVGNKTELDNLNNKIDQVIELQQKVKPIDSDALANFITNSQTIFSKLEDISTIHMDSGDVTSVLEVVKKGQLDSQTVKDLFTDSKKISEKLDVVTETTNTIRDDLVKIDRNSESSHIKTVVDNTEKAMPVLDSIRENLSSLVEQLDSSPSLAVRSKEKNKAGRSDSEPAPAEGQTDEESVECKIRKGIFFSNSIGLHCDLKELESKLESEIYTVKTFHIEKHPTSKDPEMYLRKNLDTLNNPQNETDFIIICVGTNDITKLNLDEEISDLNNIACEHSKNLVNQAQQAAQKHNIDVFIVERPARFDPVDRDPEGVRSVLTVSANGLFPSLITPLKKVHFIPLPSLSAGRTERDWFDKDGVHLTPKGMELFCLDIEAGVKSVFTDLKQDSPIKSSQARFQKAGKGMSGDKQKMNRFRKDQANYPQNENRQKFHPPGRKYQEERNVHWENNSVEQQNRNIPNGWKGQNRENRNNHSRFNSRFQRDGYQPNRNRYQQDGYFSDGWQGAENNHQYRGSAGTRHNSGGNEQYRQQGYRGQAGRTESRDTFIPDGVRDYLQRFMQDNHRRY